MSEEKFYSRHFILYAKYHYKRSENIIDDLKVLMAEYACIGVESVKECDIFERLSSIVYEYYIGKNLTRHKYDEVLFAVRGSTTNIFRALLSLICFVEADNLPDLGEPDTSVLELSDSYASHLKKGKK